jgi:hypothetical protein
MLLLLQLLLPPEPRERPEPAAPEEQPEIQPSAPEERPEERPEPLAPEVWPSPEVQPRPEIQPAEGQEEQRPEIRLP